MVLILELALDCKRISLNIHLLRIADLRDPQLFGDLRTNLSGVAVDSLAAGDDQVIPDLSQGRA